jgi:hypothetical protein
LAGVVLAGPLAGSTLRFFSACSSAASGRFAPQQGLPLLLFLATPLRPHAVGLGAAEKRRCCAGDT